MSCGLQGWFFSKQRKLSVVARAVVIAGGLLMMLPNDLTSIAGIAVLVAMAVIEMGRSKKASAAA